VSENRKPVTGALSSEDWVHAAEFVPGQMWTGCGFSESAVCEYTEVVKQN